MESAKNPVLKKFSDILISGSKWAPILHNKYKSTIRLKRKIFEVPKIKILKKGEENQELERIYIIYVKYLTLTRDIFGEDELEEGLLDSVQNILRISEY